IGLTDGAFPSRQDAGRDDSARRAARGRAAPVGRSGRSPGPGERTSREPVPSRTRSRRSPAATRPHENKKSSTKPRSPPNRQGSKKQKTKLDIAPRSSEKEDQWKCETF